MDLEWITVIGVLATSASMAVSGMTIVLVKILYELRELNRLLGGEVASHESVGYSSRDKSAGD